MKKLNDTVGGGVKSADGFYKSGFSQKSLLHPGGCCVAKVQVEKFGKLLEKESLPEAFVNERKGQKLKEVRIRSV